MAKLLRMGDIKEQDLITALQQEQPEALSQLYDKYAPVLLGLINRMVPDPDLAESLLQKTFVQIWFKKANYDASRLSLLSWVILIARDTVKKALPVAPTKQFSLTAENSKFTEAKGVEADDEEPRVKEFCCRLDQQEKLALDLVYLKGLPCEEAASQLGMSLEALKETLKMAVKLLGAEKAA